MNHEAKEKKPLEAATPNGLEHISLIKDRVMIALETGIYNEESQCEGDIIDEY